MKEQVKGEIFFTQEGLMFREMRRSRQALSKDECCAVLERCTNGVLALSGDEGYPYALPISYVFSDGKIFFHSAMEGHKIDSVRRDEKASFCVVDMDDVQSSRFTTFYRSVIAFGRIRIIEDEEKKMDAIRLLSEKYCSAEKSEKIDLEISGAWNRFLMLEFEIEHLSGKEAIELRK